MGISRRQFLVTTGCIALVGCREEESSTLGPQSSQSPDPAADQLSSQPATSSEGHPPGLPKGLAYLLPVVDESSKWGPDQLFNFVNALSVPHLNPFATALEIEDFDEKSKPGKVALIHQGLLYQASSILTWPFKSVEKINYHDLVVWCGRSMGINEGQSRFTPTYELEREITRRQFEYAWDKLRTAEREKLLEIIDTSKCIPDKAAIVAASGATALALLSGTVYFTGFSFYTTMSVIICTVAGWFGVTIPFTVYASAASTIACFGGPIGWAIGATLAAGAMAAWAGQADVKKVTSFVLQMHCMKAGAIHEATAKRG